MATANRDFLAAWEGWRIHAESYRELDAERVLVYTRMSGRGKTSGLQFGGMRDASATVFQLRSGKVARLALYWHRARAVADLGLAPEPNVADRSR